MENNYCYIEFEFSDSKKFEELKHAFEAIKNSKNNSITKKDGFWLDQFPKYALEKFSFLASDVKPNFETAKETTTTWHFYSLIELLCIQYEVEYIDLEKTSNTTAILTYDAYSYPYGGINGLIFFIESFNCIPKQYDDGTGVYTHTANEIKNNNNIWSFSGLKKLFKFSIVLLFINLIASCENKTAPLEFEKNAMYEVYPALMDTLWVNARRRYVPPPPTGMDPSEYKLNQIKESNKRFNADLAEFKKKRFPVDIIILDKAVAIDNSKELQNHFKDAEVSENNILDTLEYRFDRKKLDAYKAFHLKYVLKIPKENERKLYNECCYSIRGIFILSRIQFDSEKKYGVLTAGIDCGAMCNYGYRIYIKKNKNKWVVDKIEEAWIA
jgi:hypothetical protein